MSRRRTNLKIVLSLIAVLSPLFIISGIHGYFDERKYSFSGNELFVLTNQWLVLTPKNSVACNKEFQQLYLTVISPYEVVNFCVGCPKLKLQDGTTPIFECELVEMDGSIRPYRVAGIGLGGEPTIIFDEIGDLMQTKRKREYRAVRLRSSRPVLCADASLTCYSPPFFE
jgi:hypothetical protein